MVGGGLGLTTESLDQLKVWLRSCLLDAYGWGSDCDSLMKYVVALVKKDRSAEDLRSDCLEQLKVFFNDNTQKFVTELFDCLKTKAYLEPYGSGVAGAKNEADDPVEKGAGAEGLAFIVDKKPDPTIVSLSGKEKAKDEKSTFRERSRSRERSREKDRSPHHGAASRRRSKSPVRRSRSPPAAPRRFRSRSRSRSRERHRGGRKGRSRSPPTGRHRPRVTARRSRSKSRSPPAAVAAVPVRDLRDTLSRKHNSTMGSVPHIGGRRERCRDFDEQGFCIQGELCPFDHGTDPVILDSNVIPYSPSMRGGNWVSPVVPEYNPLEPDLRHAHPPPHDHPARPLGPPGPYPPPVGAPWPHPGHPPGGIPHMQRELVAIPRHNLTMVQRTVIGPPHENHNNGSRGGPPGRFQRGTELEVRKIPRQQNNITTLNGYFSKFGSITNIQVNFQGCPESALISFSKHHEANAAYRSTDAVLGNRFIRLFWHNSNQPNAPGGLTPLAAGNATVVNRNNNNSGLQTKKRLQLPGGIGPQDDALPKKMAKPNPEALKKDNQADKSAQLISQKSRLIDKYVEENKRLLERLDKCTSDAEKDQIKVMIANMSKIIEGLKPKVAPGALLPEITSEKQLLDAELDLYRQMQAWKQSQNPAEARQLELKLLALRRTAKTLGLLDNANVWHGRLAHKGLVVGHNAAALKAAATKAPTGQLAIDKRPRVIIVLAGTLEMAGLCKHFSRFGKIANVAEEGEGDQKHFVFTFATRKDAEFAINRGGTFRGAPLKWFWKKAETGQTAKDGQDEAGDAARDKHGLLEVPLAPAEEGKQQVGPAGDVLATDSSSHAIENDVALEDKDSADPIDNEENPLESTNPDHKLLDSCGDAVRPEDDLLEDEDEEDALGEARSWRH